LIVYDIRLRGNLAIIALSTVLLLGNTGFYTTPVFGGGVIDCQDTFGFDTCFDGGPGGTGQDWNTAANWWPIDVVPSDFNNIGIGYDTAGTGSVSFDVTIGDGISAIPPVVIGDGSFGDLQINGGSTLTIRELASLNHTPNLAETITVNSLATLTVEGIFNNGFSLGDSATLIINGIVVITGNGVLENFGSIFGTGEIQCVGNGTFNDNGSTAGSITVTGCGGAAVGSISIPLDSSSLLVGGSEMNSVWLTIAIAALVGVGAVLVTRKLKN